MKSDETLQKMVLYVTEAVLGCAIGYVVVLSFGRTAMSLVLAVVLALVLGLLTAIGSAWIRERHARKGKAA